MRCCKSTPPREPSRLCGRMGWWSPGATPTWEAETRALGTRTSAFRSVRGSAPGANGSHRSLFRVFFFCVWSFGILVFLLGLRESKRETKLHVEGGSRRKDTPMSRRGNPKEAMGPDARKAAEKETLRCKAPSCLKAIVRFVGGPS